MPKSLSYSELYAWRFEREKWRSKYIEGREEEPNEAQILGKIIHQNIEDEKYPLRMALKQQLPNQDPDIIQKLIQRVKRAPEREFYRKKVMFKKIPLTFYFDGFDRKNRVLYEYKTTTEAGKWNQFSVDYNEQLSFYALIYRQMFHRYFSDIQLHRLDVLKGTAKVFHTARGRRDLDYIAKKITEAVNEMKSLGLWEKRLTTEERQQLSQKRLDLK
jgi:hypothetical protein